MLRWPLFTLCVIGALACAASWALCMLIPTTSGEPEIIARERLETLVAAAGAILFAGAAVWLWRL